MITIVTQDILTVTEGVIGHQVNCRGKMGSGLAKQIREAYPEVFAEYAAQCDIFNLHDRYILLGTAQVVPTTKNPKLSIANIFGQFGTSKETRETEYCALHHGIVSMLTLVPLEAPVHLPFFIGCGHGRGDWEIVNTIITRTFKTFNRDLILHKFNPDDEAKNQTQD